MRTRKPKSTSSDIDKSFSLEDNAIVKETITNALEEYNKLIENESKQYKSFEETTDVINRILSEYLQDFIIIGHTLDDKRFVVRKAITDGQMDKLQRLTVVTVNHFLNNDTCSM